MRLPPTALTVPAVLVALSLAPASAAGQIIVNQSGAKVGLNVTTLTYGDAEADSPDVSRRAGFTGGLFAVRYLRPRLGIQAEGLLSLKGAEFPTGNLRLTYLESPWLLRYEFDSPALGPNVVHVVAGPALAIKIDASISSGDVSTDVGEDFRAVDLGWVVGAGLDRGGVLLDLRYTWGLMNVPADRAEGSPRVRNGAFTILVGLRIPR